MTAKERWNEYFPGPGLWLGVGPSQQILQSGEYTPPELDPAPAFVAVKFGGDWGGMWGTPETWAKLREEHPEIIPYLYCVPEHTAEYTGLVGTLASLNYKAVILDCEQEWVGQESTLRTLLHSLNLPDNLIGVTGYAWFQGPGGGPGAWPDKGEAFGAALDDLDAVYLPQAYFSLLEGAENPGDFVRDELARVFPHMATAYIVDSPSIGAAHAIAEATGLPVSVWHAGTLGASRWGEVFGGSTGAENYPENETPSEPPEIPPLTSPVVEETPPEETYPAPTNGGVITLPFTVNPATVEATWPNYAKINPNVEAQYEQWFTARATLGQDPTDMSAFRLHLITMGYPDPMEPEHPTLPGPETFPMPTDGQWLAMKEAGAAFLEAAWRAVNQH